MKWILIICCVALLGCQTVPVKPKWPDAPAVGACTPLNEALVSEKLSDLLGTVSSNYGKYHECASRVDAWQQWYKDQKQIYEQLK